MRSGYVITYVSDNYHAYIHTRIHTHTYTRTHAHTYTHTHTHTPHIYGDVDTNTWTVTGGAVGYSWSGRGTRFTGTSLVFLENP